MKEYIFWQDITAQNWLIQLEWWLNLIKKLDQILNNYGAYYVIKKIPQLIILTIITIKLIKK